MKPCTVVCRHLHGQPCVASCCSSCCNVESATTSSKALQLSHSHAPTQYVHLQVRRPALQLYKSEVAHDFVSAGVSWTYVMAPPLLSYTFLELHLSLKSLRTRMDQMQGAACKLKVLSGAMPTKAAQAKHMQKDCTLGSCHELQMRCPIS